MTYTYRLIPKAANGFKVAFDEARRKKLGYFTYDGKIFKTIKAGESKEEWESKFRNNLKEETAKLKSYGPGEHLGWKNAKKSNANTDIKTKASGDTTNGEPVQATLEEVVITAKRPKRRDLTEGKRLPKKTKITGRNLAGAYGSPSAGGQGLANQRQLEASSNAFDKMRNASANPFSLEGSRFKIYTDPNGKTYRYVTRNGINYLDNGRWWNPKNKKGGNWKYSGNWLTGGTFTHFKNGGSLNRIPFIRQELPKMAYLKY